MIFNIYYINFPKVYEIKMMLNNIVRTGAESHSGTDTSKLIDIKARAGIKGWGLFEAGGEGSRQTSRSDSQKVMETFEVKTTKSVILDEVVQEAKTIENFNDIEEGELVKLDNIKLSLENESELRLIKFVNSGALKDIVAPGTNGVDINNLFNSMFKDYAYKIKGSVKDSENEILIKIPLTFESEFESSYSVDDLFIGKVTLVGLYKGKIKLDELKNSFEFFQEIGQLQNSYANPNLTEDDEIQESHYSEQTIPNNLFFKSSGDGIDYHYLDLLAIIQNINIIK